MLGDSSFHRLAPETGNVRLPTVVREQLYGTDRLFEEGDLSRRTAFTGLTHAVQCSLTSIENK